MLLNLRFPRRILKHDAGTTLFGSLRLPVKHETDTSLHGIKRSSYTRLFEMLDGLLKFCEHYKMGFLKYLRVMEGFEAPCTI